MTTQEIEDWANKVLDEKDSEEQIELHKEILKNQILWGRSAYTTDSKGKITKVFDMRNTIIVDK
jgi:hypothetical protein